MYVRYGRRDDMKFLIPSMWSADSRHMYCTSVARPSTADVPVCVDDEEGEIESKQDCLQLLCDPVEEGREYEDWFVVGKLHSKVFKTIGRPLSTHDRTAIVRLRKFASGQVWQRGTYSELDADYETSDRVNRWILMDFADVTLVGRDPSKALTAATDLSTRAA